MKPSAPAPQPGASPERPCADGKPRWARAASRALPYAQHLLEEGSGLSHYLWDLWDEHLPMPPAALQGALRAPNLLRPLTRAGVSLGKRLPRGMDPDHFPSTPSVARRFPSSCLSFPTCKPDVRLCLNKCASLSKRAQPGTVPSSGLSTWRYGREKLWHNRALLFVWSGKHKRLLLLFSPLGASAARRAPGSGGSKLDQESAALMVSFPMQHTQG